MTGILWLEDFYLEEVVLFQIQQHILELGESDRLLQEEKERAIETVEHLKKECRTAEREIKKAKKKSLFVIEQALVKYPILSGFKPFLALTEVSL